MKYFLPQFRSIISKVLPVRAAVKIRIVFCQLSIFATPSSFCLISHCSLKYKDALTPLGGGSNLFSSTIRESFTLTGLGSNLFSSTIRESLTLTGLGSIYLKIKANAMMRTVTLKAHPSQFGTKSWKSHLGK